MNLYAERGGGGGVARVFGRSGGGGNNGDLIPAVPERVLELAVDVQSSQGPDAVRDADRAGEAPPLLVLHDEHEVPGAARADLVGPRVVLAGVGNTAACCSLTPTCRAMNAATCPNESEP